MGVGAEVGGGGGGSGMGRAWRNGYVVVVDRFYIALIELSVYIYTIFRYPFHPRVTAVARKRSRSFCQKCRWQVTAKHAYTLRMWLCMK